MRVYNLGDFIPPGELDDDEEEEEDIASSGQYAALFVVGTIALSLVGAAIFSGN